MESRKDLYDKNASEKGVDMVSLDRDTMIRISKNPGWYQDFLQILRLRSKRQGALRYCP